MSKEPNGGGALYKALICACIVGLLTIAGVGVYFIKEERGRSSASSSSGGGKTETSSAPEEDNTEEATAPEQPALTGADEILAGMNLRQKVCQLMIVTPESLTGFDQVTASGDATKAALTEYPVGGFLYFAQNLEDADQTKEMLSGAKKICSDLGAPVPFLAVDEEGGVVARCAEKLGTTKFKPMYEYKDQGTDVAYGNACAIAKDIAGFGFNLDFAPVADTWSNPANEVIGKRAYSDDFAETAELVASAVKGFKDGGVCCSLKHFPGHGDTAEDSHLGAATSSKTLDELEGAEYLAFKSGIEAGADMVMIGHITMTNVDNIPASISKKMITEELRGKLGFDGVVVTDSLAMGAVSKEYDDGELAIKALEAGADILLTPNDPKACVLAIEEAVKSGRLSEERVDESVKRILELKLKKLY